MISTHVRFWPLAQMTLMGESSSEEVEAELAALEALCFGKGAWALLVDVRQGQMTPFIPGQIRRVDDWLWVHREDLLRNCAGIAIVVEESVVPAARDLAAGLTQTLGGAVDHVVLSEHQRAQSWALDRLNLPGRAAAAIAH